MIKESVKCRFLPLRVILLLVICLYSTRTYATNLNEALVSSYKTNPEIKSAIESLKSVDEEMPGALSGMLPSASSSLQRGQKSSKVGQTESNGITDTKSIEITQPLFKGGETFASIKKAKNQIMAAREQLKYVEQQVLLAATIAYMDVVSNNEIYELALNNKSVLEHHMEAAATRFELGEVTRTDVSQAKASLAKSNSDVISTRRALEESKAAYERVIGEAAVDLKMPKNNIEVNGTIEELTSIGLATNPSVKIAEYNWNSAKDDVSIQKSALLPQINLFANKQKQFSTLNGSTTSTDINSDTFGVELSIPIYQGGAEYAKIRKAKHTVGKNSYDFSVAQNNVREAVIKAYQDYKVAQSLIESDKSNVDASALALEGTKEEAFAGLRTTLDVLDAEHALFEAKAALIKSKRDEIVSVYNLLAQLGKLTVKELGLKVDDYNPEINYNNVKHQIIGF